VVSKADRCLVVSVADHHRLFLHSNAQLARTNLPQGRNVGREATKVPEAANRTVNNLVDSSICLVIVTWVANVPSLIAGRSPARRVSLARPKTID
jgi:hypothetical protein